MKLVKWKWGAELSELNLPLDGCVSRHLEHVWARPCTGPTSLHREPPAAAATGKEKRKHLLEVLALGVV